MSRVQSQLPLLLYYIRKMTYNSSSLSVFVDGIMIASASSVLNLGLLSTQLNSLAMGCRYQGVISQASVLYLDGVIDDVQTYNVALSPRQIFMLCEF